MWSRELGHILREDLHVIVEGYDGFLRQQATRAFLFCVAEVQSRIGGDSTDLLGIRELLIVLSCLKIVVGRIAGVPLCWFKHALFSFIVASPLRRCAPTFSGAIHHNLADDRSLCQPK